jgi:hypothetical protein
MRRGRNCTGNWDERPQRGLRTSVPSASLNKGRNVFSLSNGCTNSAIEPTKKLFLELLISSSKIGQKFVENSSRTLSIWGFPVRLLSETTL